jgi:MFS family permease
VKARYRILALVTLAQAGASIVQQGIGALAPFFTVAFAANGAQIGFIFGALTGGSALTTALAGVAVDKYGERRIILLSGLVMGCALFAAALVPAYAWLLVWMFVAGIGYAASTPAGGRAILAWFTRDRGVAMGIRQMGVPLGGVAGALLLPLIAAHAGYRWALAAGGTLTAATALAAALWYRAPAGDVIAARTWSSAFGTLREVARDPRLIYVTLTCMVLITAQSSMLTFLSLTLVTDTKLSLATASAALAIAQVGACAGRLAWGALSDRLFGGDRVVPLMIACVLATLSAAATAALPVGAPALALSVALVLGFAAAGWNGLFSAALVEIGGMDRAGSALGVALTGLFATGIVAPPLFGALADAHGFVTAWNALAAFVLLGLVPAFCARRAMARAC